MGRSVLHSDVCPLYEDDETRAERKIHENTLQLFSYHWQSHNYHICSGYRTTEAIISVFDENHNYLGTEKQSKIPHGYIRWVIYLSY